MLLLDLLKAIIYGLCYWHELTIPLLVLFVGVRAFQWYQMEAGLRAETRTVSQAASYPSPYTSYNVIVDKGNQRVGDKIIQKLEVYRCSKLTANPFSPVVLLNS